MHERNVILISELKHVDEIASFLAGRPDIREEGYLLVPLDAEIEYALTKKGISFESGRAFRSKNADSMVLSEEWSSTIFDSEQWSFFRYREVSLSQLYFPVLQVYLMTLFYCADIVSNIVVRYPTIERLIVFPSTQMDPQKGFALESRRIKTLVDVVTTIAEQSHKEVLIPVVTMPIQRISHTYSFKGKRMVFSWGIGVLNTLVTVVRRPRRIRILASDYWRNMAPYVRILDSVEVVLIDRKEAFNAGLSNIFKFRMRFLHLDAYTQGSSPGRENARHRIEKEWQSVRTDCPAVLFRGFSLQSLVRNALDGTVDDAVKKSLKDIDDAYALLARLRPDVVELRTTISAQTHVGILAQVAHAQGIPSLEMQHGLEYYGPGSMDKRHGADCMGVYGKVVQQELHETGAAIRTVPTGSPRFDVYAALKKKETHDEKKVQQNIVFLCITPAVVPGMATDTYDVEEYFQSIGFVLRTIPNASAIIKLRGKNRESFYRSVIASAFSDVPYTTAQFEPLWELFPKADVVISCNSTAILEALQCGKPLVYLGLTTRERMMGRYQFSQYADQGVMRLAESKEALEKMLAELASNPEARENLVRRAKAFLEEIYAFDGKASERTAALITLLASSKPR